MTDNRSRHDLDMTIFEKYNSPARCVNCEMAIYYNRVIQDWLHTHSATAACYFRARPHCNYEGEIQEVTKKLIP